MEINHNSPEVLAFSLNIGDQFYVGDQYAAVVVSSEMFTDFEKALLYGVPEDMQLPVMCVQYVMLASEPEVDEMFFEANEKVYVLGRFEACEGVDMLNDPNW